MTHLTAFIAALRKVLRDDTRAALNACVCVTMPARPRRRSSRRALTGRLPGRRLERGTARLVRRPPA